MEFLPIKISATRGNWSRFVSRRKNQSFLEAQTKVFARDKDTCQYCGFQSKKYMVVVNKDNNYSNNKLSNLATCCSLCYPCFFVDKIGSVKGTGGYLIFLPEISQADLNHFCRVLFSSMLKDAPYKGKLQASYLSFKERSSIIDDIFGPNSHIPHSFGQSIIDSDLTVEQLDKPVIENIRYLPDRKYIKDQVIYWKNTIFDQIPL